MKRTSRSARFPGGPAFVRRSLEAQVVHWSDEIAQSDARPRGRHRVIMRTTTRSRPSLVARGPRVRGTRQRAAVRRASAHPRHDPQLSHDLLRPLSRSKKWLAANRSRRRTIPRARNHCPDISSASRRRAAALRGAEGVRLPPLHPLPSPSSARRGARRVITGLFRAYPKTPAPSGLPCSRAYGSSCRSVSPRVFRCPRDGRDGGRYLRARVLSAIADHIAVMTDSYDRGVPASS